MLGTMVRQPIVRAIARHVIPIGVRRKLAATLDERLGGTGDVVRAPAEATLDKSADGTGDVVRAPTEDHFRALLAERATMNAVPGRVLMVVGSLQPGGAERQVANTLVGLGRSPCIESLTLLCRNLDRGTRERHDFYLPMARESGALIREIRPRPRFSSERLPAGLQKSISHLRPDLAADVANLFSEFRALRPEVVHAWLDWGNVRAGLAAVLAGVPRVVLSGRNLSPIHFAFHTNYHRPAYCALSECDQSQVIFVNNSQAGADDYTAWLGLPTNRVKVIRNGVNFADEARPSAEHNAGFRARFDIPPNAPLVGGMFRFNEEKRPLLWLQTAWHVVQSLPMAHFVVFGQGPMRPQMEELIRDLGIGHRVHLCGVVAPSLNGLAPCDVVLLASRAEGTPNVLLEAQWLGKAVVTTTAAGAGEAVDDGVTGVVVPVDNAVDVADAVLRVLQDEKFRVGVRAQGPKFVAARYGMERMIAETIAAYGIDTPPARPFGNAIEQTIQEISNSPMQPLHPQT